MARLSRGRMSVEQAALLLGVDPDAEPEAVHQAFRVWARLAHPDAGGDRGHFEELIRARRTLVSRAPSPAEPPEVTPVPPRLEFSAVRRRPSVTGTVVIVVVLLAALISPLATVALPVWMAAGVMGGCATAFSVTVSRCCLDVRADVGHRIGTLMITWTPVAVVQVLIASMLGTHIFLALPVLALPLVFAVALVNPGAGLWRPIRLPNP